MFYYFPGMQDKLLDVWAKRPMDRGLYQTSQFILTICHYLFEFTKSIQQPCLPPNPFHYRMERIQSSATLFSWVSKSCRYDEIITKLIINFLLSIVWYQVHLLQVHLQVYHLLKHGDHYVQPVPSTGVQQQNTTQL